MNDAGRNNGKGKVMVHPGHDEWMKYLYGELPPAKHEVQGRHLMECSECREQVERWRGTMGSLEGGRAAYRGGRGVSLSIFRVMRWAAAAVLILALGIFAGRYTAARPDMDKLYNDLEVSLTSSLETRLKADWNEQVQNDRMVLATIHDDFRREVEQLFQEALAEYAAETYRASTETMEKALGNLTVSLGEVLDEMDRRLAEQEMMRSDLVNFAAQTQDEIMRHRQGLELLFAGRGGGRN